MYYRRTLLPVVLLFALVAAGWQLAAPPLPTTPKHPVVDEYHGEHAKLWGDHAATATWDRSAIGRKPWCHFRNAFSKVPFST